MGTHAPLIAAVIGTVLVVFLAAAPLGSMFALEPRLQWETLLSGALALAGGSMVLLTANWTIGAQRRDRQTRCLLRYKFALEQILEQTQDSVRHIEAENQSQELARRGGIHENSEFYVAIDNISVPEIADLMDNLDAIPPKGRKPAYMLMKAHRGFSLWAKEQVLPGAISPVAIVRTVDRNYGYIAERLWSIHFNAQALLEIIEDHLQEFSEQA